MKYLAKQFQTHDYKN